MDSDTETDICGTNVIRVPDTTDPRCVDQVCWTPTYVGHRDTSNSRGVCAS